MRAAEQDRPDVAALRRRWRVWQHFMDGTAFVFLDETSATTNMVRRYGWGARGERLVDAAPPMATGGPRPLSPDCVTTASSRLACSTGR